MANNTKTRRIIRRNLKKHGFIAQNDSMKFYLNTYDDGWGKILFRFGKYHDKFNLNILRRVNSIDKDWDHFSEILTPSAPKESFIIQTNIPSLGKHFEELKDFVTPFENHNELLGDSSKFNEAFSNLMESCICPFLIKAGDLNFLNNLINNPVNNWDNMHDIISGGTSVFFKKVLLANKVEYEYKDDVENFVKEIFNEKLNVKGSKDKYKIFMDTLDKITKFYRN